MEKTKIFKTFITLLLNFLIFSNGLVFAIPDTPTPTDTPLPTSTPTPSFTPGPTNSPTPVVTGTPSYSPTPTPTFTTPPTSIPTPTYTPTIINTSTPFPTFTIRPTQTPTPTIIPNCTPKCTNKACGDDGCNGYCGSCLTGFSCSSGFACLLDPDFNEANFLKSWNYFSITNDIEIYLSYKKENLQVGVDGNSLGGFTLYGKTTANTVITLYIFSLGLIKTTTSDYNGDWTILINELVASGLHNVYAIITSDGKIYKNSIVAKLTIDPIAKIVSIENGASSGITDNTSKPSKTSTSTGTGIPINFNIILFSIVSITLVSLGIGAFRSYKKKKLEEKKRKSIKYDKHNISNF